MLPLDTQSIVALDARHTAMPKFVDQALECPVCFDGFGTGPDAVSPRRPFECGHLICSGCVSSIKARSGCEACSTCKCTDKATTPVRDTREETDWRRELPTDEELSLDKQFVWSTAPAVKRDEEVVRAPRSRSSSRTGIEIDEFATKLVAEARLQVLSYGTIDDDRLKHAVVRVHKQIVDRPMRFEEIGLPLAIDKLLDACRN